MSYKRLDLVIDAGRLAKFPVVLAGGGPEELALRAHAAQSKSPVAFVRNPSDALLAALYAESHAFIFPAIEDFGIMPVEAIASGARVIVANEGGAAESVSLTGGGQIIDTRSSGEWLSAIDTIEKVDVETAARLAGDIFSVERFHREITNWLPGAGAL